LEISSRLGFKASVTCSPVRELNALKVWKERAFDLMMSSTGVFDWPAMFAKCRRKTLLNGARSMDLIWRIVDVHSASGMHRSKELASQFEPISAHRQPESRRRSVEALH
jgi:hypothetical protein